jgi:nitroimidazol reductase NimA-like FMN-containing flavoprotein (pyridoxamine 5'-phosphate oxidase superfamily)
MLGSLSNSEVEALLSKNVVGRIGCRYNGTILIVPITYAYDGTFVIGHTVEGLKIDLLRKNPECCFEVDSMESLSSWQSVIAMGTFEELSGAEASAAIETLRTRLASMKTSETSQPQRMGPSSTNRTLTQGNNPIIYRIRLKEKTGRFERP